MGRTLSGKLNHLAFRILPKHMYIRLLYRLKCKGSLNLKNPTTFREKMFWLLDYYDRKQLDVIKQCYDKYKVRDYVEQKVGTKYLVGIVGRYFTPEQIDFETLPERYVIKISQSCGMNIIVNDKSMVNPDEMRKTLSNWMTIAKRRTVELDNFHYSDDVSIIVENYLEPSGKEPLNDYKIYCINGKVEFTRVAVNPIDLTGKRKKEFPYNTYDRGWNYIKFETGNEHHSDPSIVVKKPDNLEEMYWVAEKLSEDFPFARIDLYNYDNSIYFGEITWFPGSYTNKMYPEEWDTILGDKLILPNDT
ncbi:MAG: hypothetical protein KBT07_04445 [Clostridiales bacterium]|nr:hypothetical protein [Candidatus Scatonaster coprocaballi]